MSAASTEGATTVGFTKPCNTTSAFLWHLLGSHDVDAALDRDSGAPQLPCAAS